MCSTNQSMLSAAPSCPRARRDITRFGINPSLFTGVLFVLFLIGTFVASKAQPVSHTNVPYQAEAGNDCQGDPSKHSQTINAQTLADALTNTAATPLACGNIVALKDVHVIGVLNLEGAKLVRGLSITQSRPDGCTLDGVSLRHAQAALPITISCTISHWADFDGLVSNALLTLRDSKFGGELGNGTLNLYDVHLNDTLDVSHTKAHTITLTNSRVIGQIWANDSVIGDHIGLQGAQVAGDLILDRSRAGDVQAEDARIDGTVSARSLCTKRFSIAGMRVRRLDLMPVPTDKQPPCTMMVVLNAANVDVGQNVVAEGVQTAEMRFDGASVGGDLDLKNATVSGDKFTMENVKIGGDLDLSGGHFHGVPSIVHATVQGWFSLLDATAAGFDLRDSVVGELRLWPRLSSDGTLHLDYVQANSLDLGEAPQSIPAGQTAMANTSTPPPDVCPSVPKLGLGGFAYSHLKSFTDSEAQTQSRPGSSTRRDAHWLLTCMLDKLPPSPFAMQPYRQIANALRADGHLDDANTILYQANWRNMTYAFHNKHIFDAVRSLFLFVAIGWGIGIHYVNALFCAIVFSIFGAFVLYCVRRKNRPEDLSRGDLAQWCLGASVTRLLPIPIGDKYKQYFDQTNPKELGPILRCYFVIHLLIGYFIAACIAAGITGFTQAAS